MSQRKEHLLFNECLGVGDLLDLMWAELARGAVPITRLGSQVGSPPLLLSLVFQKTTFPRLHCPLACGGFGCRWEAQSKLPTPLLRQHCWLWPCLLRGSSSGQTRPPRLQLPAGGPGPGLWESLCPSSPG